MRWLLTFVLALVTVSAQAATHTWNGSPYADGALADGDTVVGVNVTNNCTLTNNDLKITGTWSNATWTGNVISCSGIQGLLISNLVFRATDNGLGLTHSNGFNAFSLSGTGIEFCNNSVSNLYFRYESTECGAAPQGLVFNAVGATNILIHDNIFDMMGNAIVGTYSGYSTNIQIVRNVITRVSFGIFTQSSSPGDTYGWIIRSNRIDELDAWNPLGGPCGGSYHNDGIHLTNQAGGSTNHNMIVEANTFGPVVHVASALLYSQPANAWGYPGLKVINNLFLLDVRGTNSPCIVMGISNVLYANNTFISHGTSLAIGIMPTCASYNNLSIAVPQAYSIGSGYPADSDYNAWNGPWADSFSFPPFTTFADWKTATGFDSHSTTNAATLNANYAPTLADTVARGMGTNLTALGITTDFNGAARPAVGAWDIGALNAVTPAAPNTTLIGPVTMTGGTTRISQP